METRKLTLSDRSFVLASVITADRARAEIEAAVQRGGGFVRLELAGGESVEALITPTTSAFFEPFELHPDDDVAPPHDTGDYLDLDFRGVPGLPSDRD